MRKKKSLGIPTEPCPQCHGTGRRPVLESLAEHLRSERTKAEIGLRELSDILDVSPTHLSDVELGRRRPSADLVKRYLEALRDRA